MLHSGSNGKLGEITQFSILYYQKVIADAMIG